MNVAPAALVATLVVTAAAVVDVARREELEPNVARAWLAVLLLLFALRVLGQVVVWRRAPAWLPPMDAWNLVPYRILLPIQLVFLAVMTAIVVALPDTGERFGTLLMVFAAVYAGAMGARYLLRLGGTIPIVFHVVLATFLHVWGSYGAEG